MVYFFFVRFLLNFFIKIFGACSKDYSKTRAPDEKRINRQEEMKRQDRQEEIQKHDRQEEMKRQDRQEEMKRQERQEQIQRNRFAKCWR